VTVALPPSVLSIILGTALVQSANGLLQALLPLRLQATGFTTTDIGSVATAYGLGFVAGCLVVPFLVRRLGNVRAFAGLAVATGLVVLLFAAADGLASWMALRVASGLGMAGLFTVADSWVSAQARNADRGRVFALHMVGNRLALMLSPLGIGLGEVTGNSLLVAVAVLFALALLPVAAVRGEPGSAGVPPGGLRGLLRAAPTALVGSFAVGLVNGPVTAMATLYGVRVGLSPEGAALLILALQGGGLLMQWPLGLLSDRFDRRLVLGAVAAGVAALSLLLMGLPAVSPPWVRYAAFAAFGALALSSYALCVVLAGDTVGDDRMVGMVSVLLIAWSAGMMLGPLPAAVLMDAFGPAGLFLHTAGVAALLTAFIATRAGQRAG